MLREMVNGQEFRKSSFSGAGNDCVYLNGTRSLVRDSKSGILLSVPSVDSRALAALTR